MNLVSARSQPLLAYMLRYVREVENRIGYCRIVGFEGFKNQ